MSRAEAITAAFEWLLVVNPTKAPSPGDLQRALGESVKNGGDLNGRDTATRTKLLEAHGFTKERGRWHRTHCDPSTRFHSSPHRGCILR